MDSKFYILSVDGGGLKGLIAIRILQIIEELTNIPVRERFSYFAGTSTGGLILAALMVQEKGKPLYDLSYIAELYLQVGESVMQKGRFELTGKETEKLNTILYNTFGHRLISETYKPVFIPSYDTTHKKIIVFKTRAALQNKIKDLPLFDVCRATSAIPPIFPSYNLIYAGKKIECVDAGIYHLKNPALAALAEVWKHKNYYAPDGLDEKDIVMVSISTGNWGSRQKQWTTDISEILSGQTKDLQYIQEQKLKIDFKKIDFLRIDLNLGESGFSLRQLTRWMENISNLTTDKEFSTVLRKMLSPGTKK